MDKQIPRIPIEENYNRLRKYSKNEKSVIDSCFNKYWENCKK